MSDATLLDSGCSTTLITANNQVVLTDRKQYKAEVHGISSQPLITTEKGFAGKLECIRTQDLHVNLLSLGALTALQYQFRFQGTNCTIVNPDGKTIVIQRGRDNLYRIPSLALLTEQSSTNPELPLDMVPHAHTANYVHALEATNTLGLTKLKKLHRILGHRGTLHSLAKAIKTGILHSDKPFRFAVEKIPKETCATCAQVKAKKHAMRLQKIPRSLEVGAAHSSPMIYKAHIP